MNYTADLKSDHLKSELFVCRISNDPAFKWLGFSYGYSYSHNHLKAEPFKIRTFLYRFQMVFGKMEAICWISNGRASGLQIPF